MWEKPGDVEWRLIGGEWPQDCYELNHSAREVLSKVDFVLVLKAETDLSSLALQPTPSQLERPAFWDRL
jgi:hypothetical protein